MQVFRHNFSALRKQLGEWILPRRQCSSSLIPVKEVIEKQNYLFSQEQRRQLEEIGRVEKITVEVYGPPQDLVLVMNKGISTPYDCCKHISLPLCQRSPLALLNDNVLWDMHRPLPGDCRLKFLSFKDKDVFSLNQVFWRTGSFVMGAIIKKAFKEETNVLLHSYPEPKVSSGSFIYDVKMNLDSWNPTLEEMKILSGEFLLFVQQNHKIECLKVKKSLALEMFEENPHKIRQISKIITESVDSLVPLYRVDDHIDVDFGPMVSNTSFFGRCSIASVHKLSHLKGPLYRFQGIALPSGILLNSFAYGVLLRRAQHLNIAETPDLPEELRVFEPQRSMVPESLGRVYPNPLKYD